MITSNAAATLIYTTLAADTTLIDANHLTGVGRIFKSPTRPSGFVNPALTLRLNPSDIKGDQKFKDEWLLWINLYLPNALDLTPDRSATRAGRIESRIDALLDDERMNNTDITRLLVNRYLPGRMLPVDPDAPNETAWQFQYYIEAT